MKNIKSNILLLIIVVIILIALVFSNNNKTQENSDNVICTMDAMQCSNGSWVGRTGADCKFVCPNNTATSTEKSIVVEVKLGERMTPLDESITLLSIVEDSRCPIDVQCIQAGTVRIKVKIESGMGESTIIFTLNKTVTTETEEFTLIEVRPIRKSTDNVVPSDYIFVFKVTKR